MAGVRITVGADVQATNLQISVGEDGGLSAGPLTLRLRTDMWPFWISDAIQAAAEASDHAATIPGVHGSGDEPATTQAMIHELQATMRAITSASFGIDGFYAAVKARSPTHPQQIVWRAHRTSRARQIASTFSHHLRLSNASSKEVTRRVRELFRFRDKAVHLDSRFRDPIYRPDVDTNVDWHFAMFRSQNALNAVTNTVQMLDALVGGLDRGSTELTAYKATARKAMNDVLDQYDAASLPPIRRQEPTPSSERNSSSRHE